MFVSPFCYIFIHSFRTFPPSIRMAPKKRGKMTGKNGSKKPPPPKKKRKQGGMAGARKLALPNNPIS